MSPQVLEQIKQWEKVEDLTHAGFESKHLAKIDFSQWSFNKTMVDPSITANHVINEPIVSLDGVLYVNPQASDELARLIKPMSLRYYQATCFCFPTRTLFKIINNAAQKQKLGFVLTTENLEEKLKNFTQLEILSYDDENLIIDSEFGNKIACLDFSITKERFFTITAIHQLYQDVHGEAYPSLVSA